MSYTKCNFVMTSCGIFTLLFDYGIDLWITVKYFQEGLYLFGFLTILFIIISTIIIQIFSYTWFKDDCSEQSCGRLKWVLLIHLFLSGIFLRYWYVVKYGYKAVYSCDQENRQKTIKRAVDAMTDISMLRCFKTYLESTPQLILQLFILIDHGEITLVQYASVLISVSSISWSTVDYQMSLRKSLQGKKGISVGFPMVTYVSYKLFTLTSWILSIVFLLVCNIFIFATLLVSVGLVGLVWVFMQHTHFCKSKGMEYLYRLVAGLIFLFTFFNVKGQKTRLSMSIYYIFRVLSTIVILTLCFYFKPLLTHTLLFRVLSISVVLSLGLGIISLIVYYGKFHPTLHSKDQNIDTVDGFMEESRIEHFIMI